MARSALRLTRPLSNSATAAAAASAGGGSAMTRLLLLLMLFAGATALAQQQQPLPQRPSAEGAGGGGAFGGLFSRARLGGRPFGHFGRRMHPSQSVPLLAPRTAAAVSLADGDKPLSAKEESAAATPAAAAAATARPLEATTTAAAAAAGVKPAAQQQQQRKLSALSQTMTTPVAAAGAGAAATRSPSPVLRPKPVEAKSGVGRSDALRGVETGSFVVGDSENYVDKVYEIKPGKSTNKINTETRMTAAGSQYTQQESVREGETAIVHCSFDEMPLVGGGLQQQQQQTAQIWWTKMPTRATDKPLVMAAGGQVRVPDERLKVVSFPDSLFSILIIRGAVAEDSAEYKCSLPTVTGYRTSFTRLEVRESLANQIESSEPHLAVKSGDDLRLFCKPRGAVATTVWWGAKTLDGRTIPLAGADDKVWGESLLVPSIAKEMEGVYTCYVESTDGVIVRKHFSVNVKERPWTIAAYRQGLKADAHLSKLDRHIAYGETLSLRCDSGGLPKPKITWFKNGAAVNVGGDDKYTLSVYEPSYKPNAVVSKLNVSQFSAADAGRYTCVAENDMGVREHSFDVRGTENLI